MSNVFNTTREINTRFDLKGSTQGRRTKKNPSDQIDSSIALKDLDFLDLGLKINLDKPVKDFLL